MKKSKLIMSAFALALLFGLTLAGCEPSTGGGTTYTVTFDKNTGDTDASPTKKIVTPPETTVGSLPANPAKSGYTFTGWNTAANGSGTAFTAETTVTADITVYAQWTPDNNNPQKLLGIWQSNTTPTNVVQFISNGYAVSINDYPTVHYIYVWEYTATDTVVTAKDDNSLSFTYNITGNTMTITGGAGLASEGNGAYTKITPNPDVPAGLPADWKTLDAAGWQSWGDSFFDSVSDPPAFFWYLLVHIEEMNAEGRLLVLENLKDGSEGGSGGSDPDELPFPGNFNQLYLKIAVTVNGGAIPPGYRVRVSVFMDSECNRHKGGISGSQGQYGSDPIVVDYKTPAYSVPKTIYFGVQLAKINETDNNQDTVVETTPIPGKSLELRAGTDTYNTSDDPFDLGTVDVPCAILTIKNDAGNTTVRITTETITGDTNFDSLSGVVATGQGSLPFLTWEPEADLTDSYNVMLRLVRPPNTVKYQNGVSFINGFGEVDWETMDTHP
jgi:uncharacterized repeat protein (TIGR02543 family)